MANAELFVNDKTSTVQRLIDSLKITLQKKYHLSADNVQAFSDDIQHELRQLELSGSLTQDKVKQSLDKLQHQAIKQKYVTEAQYKEIANNLQSSLAPPTWYQRVFSGPTRSTFDDASFSSWIASSVTQRLQQNKDLTKDEINAVIDTVKKAVQSTTASAQDLSKLATAAWWKQLSHDLEKNAKLKQNQVSDVVESLKDEVNAYKIFAMDYAGDASKGSKSMLSSASKYLMDTGNSIYRAVVNPVKAKEAEAEAAASSASAAANAATNSAGYSASSLANAAANAAASATDAAGSSASSLRAAASGAVNDAANAASSATDAAGSSASSIRSQASQSVNNAKNSFGHFWRQKEIETYKKIGYTEAHIDWVENYLSKTFHDKTNLAKSTVQDAMRTIRQYLVNTKVQTAAHIDSQLKSLENLLESWRKTVVRDEL